ncbi:MAG: hypothetical protein SV253_02035 [Halobacteria archaeon]|nr:hypothetical protein [Halobacteria archaeon]
MKLSEDTVEEVRREVVDDADDITRLINFARRKLGEVFDQDVRDVTEDEVIDEFETVLEDEDLAVNLAALVKLGEGLEVENDYDGFIVDEIIGRRIASMIAGDDPHRTLAESTFHYIDVYTEEVVGDSDNRDEEATTTTAGYDDVLAGIAAGIQTRLPGWDWDSTT